MLARSLTRGGGSGPDFQFEVVILDPKTRIVLSAFTEAMRQPANRSAGRKKFEDAMTGILNDVKKPASQPAPPSPSSQ